MQMKQAIVSQSMIIVELQIHFCTHVDKLHTDYTFVYVTEGCDFENLKKLEIKIFGLGSRIRDMTQWDEPNILQHKKDS